MLPRCVYIISETTAVTCLRMSVSEAVYIEPCCVQHPIYNDVEVNTETDSYQTCLYGVCQIHS